MKRLLKFLCFGVVAVACLHPGSDARAETLTYTITGQRLEVSPAALAVPKGIPGSVAVNVRAGGEGSGLASQLAENAVVQATLRGPGLEPRLLVGPPNGALSLPPLNVVGDYSLDDIKLVDRSTGAVRLEGTPSSVPVSVFDEVLVARVTSRPLTSQEIEEAGIVIDENNFRAVEFEVGFVVDGATVPVRFPVISPSFRNNTEIVPDAEVNARLAEARRLNNEIRGSVELPAGLKTSRLEIDIQPINIQFTNPAVEQELQLSIPPIAGLVIIPNNIGFLNQFFGVQVIVENAAPTNSGLSVTNISAELVLPKGEDQLSGASYEEPGDDPLRFARIGNEAEIFSQLPVRQAGSDGEFGTADDVARFFPGDTGQAEFFVEGLREGLHLVDVTLRGDLEGLAAGVVEVEGRAAGSVFVRNPNFSVAFSHPRTIRSGEPYTAKITILNTSQVTANQLSVNLAKTSLSGAVLESDETVSVGDVAPGETRTAEFRLRAQRTGSITFSQFSTDEDVVGRFRLRMGIDERGVELSPNSIGYPDYVDDLPESLFDAADRVLGQGLSTSMAAVLPPGVIKMRRDFLSTRVLELAEAGQRLRYGDTMERVLHDILLDWQGARAYDEGFDQILRETDAGREWREAIISLLEAEAPGKDPCVRIIGRAADLAGRGEAWWIASTDSTDITTTFRQGDATVTSEASEVPQTLAYQASDGELVFAKPGASNAGGMYLWHAEAEVLDSPICLMVTGTDGVARQYLWPSVDLPAGGIARSDPGADPPVLEIDADGDGTFEATLTANLTTIQESAPELVAAIQDTTVIVGRPYPRCSLGAYNNYGTVVAVLFNKPMDAGSTGVPASYILDNGIRAASVAIQPNGRVAILNLREGIGTIFDRSLTASGMTDPRGNELQSDTLPVQTTASDGIAIQGRVVRADGSPAANVPVTLTYYEQQETVFECISRTIRPSQVFTDEAGNFDIDFIIAGPQFSLSTTDTAGLDSAAIDIILQTAGDDIANRDKLLELANSENVQGTLLEAFAVGALPQAIALAQGLNRAVLRDVIETGSVRTGNVQNLALRFRGRATVSGQVFRPDGTTPVPGAVVNLFPDPASREQGRGVVADASGRFNFFGVPLGSYTIKAADNSGRTRSVSDVITIPGEQRVTNVVLLDLAVVEKTSLAGRVFESDGQTAHAGGRVFVGTMDPHRGMVNVVAVVDADAHGFWSAADIPVGEWDVLTISVNGRRSVIRHNIDAISGTTTQVNLILPGQTTVSGRVEFADGALVENAIVAGGIELVRTDANGNFTLQGVPTGARSISAGLERDPDNGILFPRIGSSRINVVEGTDNFVVIRFSPKGTITGRAIDPNGNPVPNIFVALPDGPSSFLYAPTDANGVYVFENLDLKEWTLSAPAPPVANSQAIIEQSLSTLADAAQGEQTSQQDLLGAITDAYSVFTGINDPLINGDGENYNPASWGYKKVRLRFDGQVANVDVAFFEPGTVSGVVTNGEGVPIGARVRLTGVGPAANGDVSFIIRGERNSDPATGVFEFPESVFAGTFGLQAASPFFPEVITYNDATSVVESDKTGIVLAFPPEELINGRLTGRILNPDQTPVGADVNVKISFGNNYVIRTDEDGYFDTQIEIPRGRYTIEVEDPVSGLVGRGVANVRAGEVNVANVRLLGKGDLNLVVQDAAGNPVDGVSLNVRQTNYPFETFDLTTDSQGEAGLTNLFEGNFSVRATLGTGVTTISGTNSVRVVRGGTASVTVTLQSTGTIQGRFVLSDGTTPVEAAEVQIGSGLGFATTDANGEFSVGGLPLGNYRVLASDPVNGQVASGNATLSTNGQIATLTLVQRTLGQVTGTVINATRTGIVPGANISLTYNDGLTSGRSTTAGPDGRFEFPGVIEGGFRITASDSATGRQGGTSATLVAGQESLDLNIYLSPLGEVTIQIFEPDGTTPAPQVAVDMAGITGDTDAEGKLRLVDLNLGNYGITARSIVAATDRSAVRGVVSVNTPGINPEATFTLSGVGAVTGTAYQSDGVTPLVAAPVTFRSNSSILGARTENAVTGADGTFSFTNVAVGSYRVTVTNVALAGSVSGEIASDGEADDVRIVLGSSGSVRGRIVRADGATPVADQDVGIFFTSQSGSLGVASDRTAADGVFEFSGIPLGAFEIEALEVEFNGIVKHFDELTENGQDLDIGDLVFDEDDPEVVAVTPEDGAVDVMISSGALVEFNEAILPGSFSTSGIYIQGENGRVSSTLSLEEDGEGVDRFIRITPNAVLESETTYSVVVLDGERRAAGNGAIVARGPRDLYERPLVIPFQSTFTTADERPPELLSITPALDAVQIDLRSVLRLSFDEPIQDSGFTIELTGPAGLVSGQVAAGVDGRVVVFTPDVELDPNVTYSLSASGFFDIAGNPASGEPYTSSFQTLDTIGPDIASIGIKNDAVPEALSQIEIEITLAVPEAGARIRVTQDFVNLGETTTPGDLALPVSLPESGTLTFRAFAVDRYGNEGPFVELLVDVVENEAPTLEVRQLSPSGNSLPTGAPFVLRAEASDESSVSETRAAVSGATYVPLAVSNGDFVDMAGVLPADTGPDDELFVYAQAFDSGGKSTGELRFSIPFHDATNPVVDILSPEADSEFSAGASMAMNVQMSDNFGVDLLKVRASGAFVFSQDVDVTPDAGTEVEQPLSIDIPVGTVEDGSIFTVRVTAVDAAGNQSITSERSFRMVDNTPPALVNLTPADAASDIALWPHVVVDFDDSLDPISVTETSVTLDKGGVVAGTVTLENEGRTIRFAPDAPLDRNGAYVISVSDSVLGADGNAIVPITSSFSVTDMTLVDPLANARFIEGETGSFDAASPNAKGVVAVVYSVGGTDVATGGAPGFAASGVWPAPATLGVGPPYALEARAQVAENAAILIPAPATMGDYIGQVGESYAFEVTGVDNQSVWGSGPYYYFSHVATAAVHAGIVEVGETKRVRLTMLPPAGGFSGTTQNGVTTSNLAANVAFQIEAAPLAEVPLASVAVEVYPASGDEDEDGILNGDEIAVGLDPFFDDAGEDPDEDNLTNLEEVALGTKPFDSDTDGDGIRDDIDSDPLVPNSGYIPVAGKAPLRNLALHFDGVDDHAMRTGGQTFSSSFSVEFWFRNEDDFTGDSSLKHMVSANNVWYFYYTPAHELAFALRNTSGTSFTVTSDALVEGWHHVAAVYDIDEKEIRLFVDGVLSDSITLSGDAVQTSGNWFIGNNSSLSATTYFHGAIDELRAFSSVRDQQTIRQDMFRRVSSGRLRWNFDEGSGIVAYDDTNGNSAIGGQEVDIRLGGSAFAEASRPEWGEGAPGIRASWTATTTVGTQVTLDLVGYDEDGAPVDAVVTALPAHGKLYQAIDGSTPGTEITTVPQAVTDSQNRVIYVPDAAFIGPDTLRYQVEDPFDISLETTVSIRIDPRNQLPVANDDTVIAFEDFINVIDVTSNDTDAESEALVPVAVSQPANGTVTINEDGTLDYEPNAGFTGSDSFTYTIADAVFWLRALDYDAGSSNGSLSENPSTGPFGYPVWSHDYVRKQTNDIEAFDLRASARMLWDTNLTWDSINRGMWTMNYDYPPGIVEEAIIVRDSTSYNNRSYVPVVRWINPFESFDADVVGSLRIIWPAATGVDGVEILVGTMDAETGASVELLRQQVARGGADETWIEIDHRDLQLDLGDSIVLMAEVPNDSEGTFTIEDRLAVVPSSATNTATVTLDVRQNSSPTPKVLVPGSGLELTSSSGGGGGGFGGGGGQNQASYGVSDPLVSLRDSFTVSIWFENGNDFSSNTNARPIIHKGADQSADFALAYTSADKVELQMVNSSGQSFSVLSPVLSSGVHHAVGVYDLDTGELRLYLDGTFVGFVPASGQVRSGANNLLLGTVSSSRFGGGGAQKFAGLVDELSLWSRALDGPEVLSLWQRTLDPTNETGLVGYWPMNAGTGATLEDQTANNLDIANIDGFGGGGSDLPWAESFAPFEGAPVVYEDELSPIILEGVDADNEPLSARVHALPVLGQIFQTPDGAVAGDEILAVPSAVTDSEDRILYLSNPEYSGFDTLEYSVDDGKVESAPAVLIIRVLPTNDAPLAFDDPSAASTTEGVPVVTVNVLANDTDIDGDTLNVASFSDGSAGTVAYNGDGTFTYTPGFGFGGTDTFTYTATDGDLESAPATVSVNVSALPGVEWINASGGTWHDGANWQGGQVPGSGEKALIELDGDFTITVNATATVGVIQMTANSGRQTLDVNATLTIEDGGYLGETSRYEQNAGILDALGPVRFLGELVLDGATWQGAGPKDFGPTATVALAEFTFNDASVTNEGTVTVDNADSAINLGAGVSFVNRGLLDLVGSRDWEGSGSLVNANSGTLRKSGNNQVERIYIEVPFTNDGEVDIQTGRLNLANAATGSGDFTVAEGTSLQFSGTETKTFSGTLDCAGSLDHSSGTTIFTGPITQIGYVYVNTGALTLDGGNAIPISRLVHAGVATLSGNSSLILGAGYYDQQDSYWNGGNSIWSIANVTIEAGRSFVMNPTHPRFDGCSITNHGTIDWTLVGSGRSLNGAKIENYGEFNIDFNAGANVLEEVVDNLREDFVNHDGGTIRLSGLTSSFPQAALGFYLINDGLLQVDNARASLHDGGEGSGTIEVINGGVLRFYGSDDFNFDENSTITGDGTIELYFGREFRTAGTLDFTGDWILVNSPTLRFNQSETVSLHRIEGYGTITGTAPIEVLERITLTSGLSIYNPSFTIPAGAQVNGVASLNFYGTDQQILNEGEIRPSNNFGLYVRNGGTVINEGLIEVPANARLRIWDLDIGTGTDLFINRGTINLTSETSILQISATPFSNEGQLSISGKFENYSTEFINTGQIAIAESGSFVNFHPVNVTRTHRFEASGSLVNEGLFEITSSSGSFSNYLTTAFFGSYQSTGTTRIGTRGSLNIAGTDEAVLGQLDIVASTGTVTGIGPKRVTKDSESRGVLTGTGLFTVDETVTLNLSGGQIIAPLQNYGTVIIPSSLNWRQTRAVVENFGSMRFTAAGTQTSPSWDPGASLVNRSGGLMLIDLPTSSSQLSFNGLSFQNEGTLQISSGIWTTNTEWLQGGAGNPTTQLAGGSLQTSFVDGLVFDAGVLTGTGTITGDVYNNTATVRPGSPYGTLTIDGDYHQAVGGVLESSYGGSEGSGLTDRLETIGSPGIAWLNGTFRLDLVGGYSPEIGTVLSPLGYVARSGTFSNFEGTTDLNGVDLTPTYGAVGMVLEAEISAPQPASVATYDEWVAEQTDEPEILRQHGSGLLEERVSLSVSNALEPTDDPDQDGRPNLLEYAFFGDALTADSVDEIRLVDVGDWFELVFDERMASDLNYRVEGSNNLKDWQALAKMPETYPEVYRRADRSTGRSSVRVRIPKNEAADEFSFFRINVEQRSNQ